MGKSMIKKIIIFDLLLIFIFTVGYVFIEYFSGIAHGQDLLLLLLVTVMGSISFTSKALVWVVVNGEINKAIGMHASSFIFLALFFYVLVSMLK
ncbi:hypothetical protein [Alkalicoccus daliensis]|uniref:Uncharacterized protein n=1 Tax=Alkalicoccus daliensis TaxID=745820 RepID=A0A1H0D4I5_9BACI|nr:hypothetical protein [Alkalicoccus daliensis]SDN65009.1 hypothetical protein SAMN04488053_102339 [Alkalicoccus daliensis]